MIKTLENKIEKNKIESDQEVKHLKESLKKAEAKIDNIEKIISQATQEMKESLDKAETKIIKEVLTQGAGPGATHCLHTIILFNKSLSGKIKFLKFLIWFLLARSTLLFGRTSY